MCLEVDRCCGPAHSTTVVLDVAWGGCAATGCRTGRAPQARAHSVAGDPAHHPGAPWGSKSIPPFGLHLVCIRWQTIGGGEQRVWTVMGSVVRCSREPARGLEAAALVSQHARPESKTPNLSFLKLRFKRASSGLSVLAAVPSSA